MTKDTVRKQDVEKATVHRAWSTHEATPLLGGARPPSGGTRRKSRDREDDHDRQERTLPQSKQERKGNFVLYVIYAVVNVIIAVPGLYGTFFFVSNIFDG